MFEVRQELNNNIVWGQICHVPRFLALRVTGIEFVSSLANCVFSKFLTGRKEGLFLPLSAKSSSLAFLPSKVFGSLSWRLFPNMVKARSFSETSEVSACRNAAELNWNETPKNTLRNFRIRNKQISTKWNVYRLPGYLIFMKAVVEERKSWKRSFVCWLGLIQIV